MLRADADPEICVFDPAMRIMHWLTVLLMMVIFALAFSIDFAGSRAEALALIQLHRSFGLSVWALTVARLAWRQFSQFPNWPADMPRAMRSAAHWSEYTLYALLLAQPILGLLHTNADGDQVNLFFIVKLPALIGRNYPLSRQLHEAHVIVGLVLLGLIALHAAAALYHHFWRRDDTLAKMLPPLRRSRDARDGARVSVDRHFWDRTGTAFARVNREWEKAISPAVWIGAPEDVEESRMFDPDAKMTVFKIDHSRRVGAHFAWRLSPALRDIVGAWLVCLAIAAACFAFLAAAAPAHDARSAALIDGDRAARLAAVEPNRPRANRPGRC
ncbi:MAG: cytochrome b [Alphaproteobacteria bacterium]|nr:cytochrome b [Alphaproteobacteria bacterium]